jgi:hypothetical protein
VSTKTHVVDGTTYLSKNEMLDVIGQLTKQKTPLLGIEIVAIEEGQVETDVNKTLWFKSQRGVYKAARLFAMRQMIGKWNWGEIKY